MQEPQEDRYYEKKVRSNELNTNDHRKPKCDTCGKMHKTENCWDGANAANDPRRKRREFTIPTNKINEHPLPGSPTHPNN